MANARNKGRKIAVKGSFGMGLLVLACRSSKQIKRECSTSEGAPSTFAKLWLYTRRSMRARLFILFLLLSGFSFAQTPSTFPALEQWRDAVIQGNPAALKSLYSLWPPVTVSTREGKVDTDTDVAFWTGLQARSMSINVVEAGSRPPGVVVFTLQVK